MNKELVKEWINALRSGEYKQGKACLENTNTNEFCCLGVAAKIALNHGLINREVSGGTAHYTTDNGDWIEEEDYTHLPSSIRQLFGITERMQSELIAVNDDDERSFSEIADYIETNILEEE